MGALETEATENRLVYVLDPPVPCGLLSSSANKNCICVVLHMRAILEETIIAQNVKYCIEIESMKNLKSNAKSTTDVIFYHRSLFLSCSPIFILPAMENVQEFNGLCYFSSNTSLLLILK